MKNAIISLVIVTIFGVAVARDLPDFIHVCKRNDPNVEACIMESVQFLKPYLTRGVPEYSIPSLEPLLLKELVAAEGTGIRVTAKDVYVYGASDFTVTKIKFDLENLRFNLDVSLPNIFIQGLYNIDGKVLLLPIRGQGPMNGNFTNCKGAVKLQTQIRKSPTGENFIEIVEFKMKISVGQGSLKLDNLFGGERVLGDVINSAINSNFDAFLKELQPLVEKALSEAFLEIGNTILDQFTFEQLFPLS